MSKNERITGSMTTKTMTYCALLAALQVAMARLFGLMPSEYSRFSIEAVPTVIAGILFGPVAGGLVGFVADLVGCLFSGYGYNPLFCLPPIMYGVCGGLFRPVLVKKLNIWTLFLTLLPAVVLGSILWQSWALGFVSGKGFWLFFTTRSIQFAITIVVDAVILRVLFQSKIFQHMGLWSVKEKKKKMTVEQAIEYIHSNYWNGGTFGLDRTVELLDKLGHPEKGLKFIHIGGTNGKGSTASMTANILQKAGYTVGLYTSPYIFKFHERMQVNGECITDEELVDIVSWIKPVAQSMESEPSEFELVTAIAFTFFRRRKCDIIALEVGLGGEFDATNTIEPPEVAVMTNIGLDHVELLGDTLEKIAGTKSKIIKKGSDCVIYREPASVEAVFEDRCKEVGACLTRADFDSLELVSASLEGQTFHWGPYKNIETPLLGEHQLKNAAVVLTVVDVLRKRGWNISEEAVREGIATVRWPGRFELIGKEPTFIIDGGHNPQCIEALVKNVRDYLDGRRLTILTGVLGDKDYNEMYRDMAPFASEFVTVTPDNPRAMSAEKLKEYLEQFGKPVTACETVAEGVSLAKSFAGKDGVVLAYGSLYMLGDIVNAAREI